MNCPPSVPFRVLEVGNDDFFFRLFPAETTRVCTHETQKRSDDPRRIPFNWRSAAGILRRIQAREFDLIVVRPTGASLGRVVRNLRRFHSLGSHFILLADTGDTPVVICDTTDTMVIPRKNFIFFRKADVYFKSELPQNNWHAFLFTTRRNEDVSNIRRQPFFQMARRKLRPLPLNTYRTLDFPEIDPRNKTVDVFYVGDNPKTTVRVRGMKVLEELKARGLRIDLPAERISPEEFRSRMARAWLVWSPEGSGWETIRHHEAILHGSVPVINYPTIDRYKPLIDGRHAFYYGCEEQDLARVIEHGLADTSRLLEMMRAGRDHLRQWYTRDAVLRYVLQEVAASRSEKSGAPTPAPLRAGDAND